MYQSIKDFKSLTERLQSKILMLQVVLQQKNDELHKARLMLLGNQTALRNAQQSGSTEAANFLSVECEKAHLYVTQCFEQRTVLLGRIQQCAEFCAEEEAEEIERQALADIEEVMAETYPDGLEQIFIRAQ